MACQGWIFVAVHGKPAVQPDNFLGETQRTPEWQSSGNPPFPGQNHRFLFVFKPELMLASQLFVGSKNAHSLVSNPAIFSGPAGRQELWGLRQ